MNESDRNNHLAHVKGWLDEDDPFFAAIEEIVESRFPHRPRSLEELDLVELLDLAPDAPPW